MVGVNRLDILNYVLKELGYLGKAPKEKVHLKYTNMPKKEYNKLVYRLLNEYNRYFKPTIQDKIEVVLDTTNNSYIGRYTYYAYGVKDEVEFLIS